MCRADTIRMDLWKEMRDSGCFGVKLGFESGNQLVVDTIVNKRDERSGLHDAIKHHAGGRFCMTCASHHDVVNGFSMAVVHHE